MNILVIEDDLTAAKTLVQGMEQHGHTVDHVADGALALDQALDNVYDAWVVDRMLPNIDGLTIVSQLRERGNKTPALILSALDAVDDRIEGLAAGGDDYLVKPYALTELLARLEALVRRAEMDHASTALSLADLDLDVLKRKVTRAGQSINLQPREVRLLEYLMRHAGQVVTRTMLLENVWDYNFDPQTNVIDVQISRLRSKIDKGFDTPLLHTVRGAGYCLSESEPPL